MKIFTTSRLWEFCDVLSTVNLSLGYLQATNRGYLRFQPTSSTGLMRLLESCISLNQTQVPGCLTNATCSKMWQGDRPHVAGMEKWWQERNASTMSLLNFHFFQMNKNSTSSIKLRFCGSKAVCLQTSDSFKVTAAKTSPKIHQSEDPHQAFNMLPYLPKSLV